MSIKENHDRAIRSLNKGIGNKQLFSDRPHRKTNYFWWFLIGVTVFCLVGMVFWIEYAIEIDRYFDDPVFGFKRRAWFQVVLTVIVLFPLCFRFVRNKLFR